FLEEHRSNIGCHCMPKLGPFGRSIVSQHRRLRVRRHNCLEGLTFRLVRRHLQEIPHFLVVVKLGLVLVVVVVIIDLRIIMVAVGLGIMVVVVDPGIMVVISLRIIEAAIVEQAEAVIVVGSLDLIKAIIMVGIVVVIMVVFGIM